MLRFLFFLFLLGVEGLSQAHAAQSTSNGSFSMSVAQACRIASVSALSFGNYNALGENLESPAGSKGMVSVVCTNGTSTARVTLSQGGNPEVGSSCSNPLRRMGNGRGGFLPYGIYQDVNRTLPWGCGSQNGVSLPTFGRTLTPVNLTTFGTIPAGQPAVVGDYVDTVEVIVTF